MHLTLFIALLLRTLEEKSIAYTESWPQMDRTFELHVKTVSNPDPCYKWAVQ